MSANEDHDFDVKLRRTIDALGAGADVDAERRLQQRLLEEFAHRASGPRRTSRRKLRVGGIAATSAVAAATLLAAIAISPWPGGDPSSSDPGRSARSLPPLGPARATAATSVLQAAAAHMRDAGEGEWRYVRVSGWYRLIARSECIGNDCVHFDARGNKMTPPPATRNDVLERWSNGETELGRQQRVEGSPDKCIEPSPLVRCVGEPYTLWVIEHAPQRFPADAREAEVRLRELAWNYNRSVADPAAKRNVLGLHVTAVDVAVILLTQPVYDAENRARIVRGLSYWQGARLGGPVTDRLGRTGTQVILPSLDRSYSANRGGDVTYAPRNKTVVLVLDVEGGRLLQYAELDSVDPPAMQDGFMVVEEQSLQEEPRPAGDPIDIKSFSKVTSTAVA